MKNIQPIQVFQIPALSDNYIHILRNSSNQVAVVDPSVAEPVNDFLKQKNWSLDYILNTHHHYDHIGGNQKLKQQWNAKVIGFEKDAHRIPMIDQVVKDNQVWNWNSHPCHILWIPGHTLGHIAFWFSKDHLLFCGDTLFAMGCGRLFEGTPKQMLSSLKKMTELSDQTMIYCGHEYSEKNARFAIQIEEDNVFLKERIEKVFKKRKKNLSTVPFLLGEEKKTNPFLRCHIFIRHLEKITHAGLSKWMQNQNNISELDCFTQIRKLRDQF